MIKLMTANVMMEKEYSYSCEWSSEYMNAANLCCANSYPSKRGQDI